MILYLSRNESANLLDDAASEKTLHICKKTGNFSLSDFIVLDMRKFASCRYFCIERLAITEDNDKFLEALKSFQMMYSAKIIIIHEGANETDSLVQGLIQIGVTDIVTAFDIEEKHRQIVECLYGKAIPKQRPVNTRKTVDVPTFEPIEEPIEESIEESAEQYKETQSISLMESEDEQYRFDCLNVKIGIIGATRRVGTTTVALRLAGFINSHGGTACYVALNTNRHLESIANAYNFDTEEDYYTRDSIDFYECMLPKHDYNFIISDFGDCKREAVRKYKESNIHLFCGASDKPYEITEFADGLKTAKSVKPKIITYAPNPEYAELFHSTITDCPIVIKPVKHMLDFKTNGDVFKELVQEYIVETSKRL